MEETKKWYQSKGVMGAVVTILALVVGFFGYEITSEEQASLLEIVTTLAGVVGSAVAIVGRVRATKKVG